MLCSATARQLLDTPQDQHVLHGDIHHANILNFSHQDWRVIDPKGVYGERGFDYANIFLNPEPHLACNAALFHQWLNWVTKHAGLCRQRLLQWILSWCGLSATWLLEEGLKPDIPLTVATLSAKELGFLPLARTPFSL